MNNEDWYFKGAWVTGVISGIIIWVSFMMSYSIVGFLLGWIPAIIGGMIIGAIWPVAIMAICIFVITS